MSINMRLKIFAAALSVAFVVCGCHSANNKWGITSRERTPKIQRDSEERSSSSQSANMAKRSGSTNEVSGKTSEKTKEALSVMEQGDLLRKNGQFDEARVVYESALSISPDNKELHHRLAIIADKQQQYSVADQHYQAALRVRPNDVNILSDLGYSYTLRGNTEKAEKTLKQAIAIDPTHRGALANLGTIYAQQNRYSEALAIFRKGTASEAEAKQNVAKLFSRASGTSPQMFASLASNTPDMEQHDRRKTISEQAELDLSSLTSDQLKAELARRDRPGEKGRGREKSWDDPEQDGEKSDQVLAKQERNTSDSSDRELVSKVATVDSPRERSDSQVFQARGQTHDDGTGGIQPTSSKSSLNQMATRVGMNSGPANLFPVLSFKNEGLDSSGAALPGRQSMSVSTASWRDNLQNSAAWDSDTLNYGSSGTGFDSTGRSDKREGTESSSFAIQGSRNDGARSYNDTWPKTTEISNRQNQSPSNNGNGRSQGGIDNFSANLKSGTSTGRSRIPKAEFPGGSPAQWPDAPN